MILLMLDDDDDSNDDDDDSNDDVDDDDDCGVKMIMAASAMESGTQLGPGSLHTLLWCRS